MTKTREQKQADRAARQAANAEDEHPLLTHDAKLAKRSNDIQKRLLFRGDGTMDLSHLRADFERLSGVDQYRALDANSGGNQVYFALVAQGVPSQKIHDFINYMAYQNADTNPYAAVKTLADF